MNKTTSAYEVNGMERKTKPVVKYGVIRTIGIGMDSQTVRHIFEKFCPANRSRKQDRNGLFVFSFND